MALPVADLYSKVYDIFKSMQEGGKDNEYMGKEIGKEIAAYIDKGSVTTTDTGEMKYVGAGTGTMKISGGDLGDLLTKTFEDCEYNEDLATNIANDIDTECPKSDTVTTATVGVFFPPGAETPVPAAGTGKGAFSSVKMIIQGILIAAFEKMQDLESGGDEVFAAQIAAATHAYMMAGKIQTDIMGPFTTGSGNGKIA
jgi:hypothetical protein